MFVSLNFVHFFLLLLTLVSFAVGIAFSALVVVVVVFGFFFLSLVIFHVVRSHCDIQLISNATEEMNILDAPFAQRTNNKHWTANAGHRMLIVASGNGKLIR